MPSEMNNDLIHSTGKLEHYFVALAFAYVHNETTSERIHSSSKEMSVTSKSSKTRLFITNKAAALGLSSKTKLQLWRKKPVHSDTPLQKVTVSSERDPRHTLALLVVPTCTAHELKTGNK